MLHMSSLQNKYYQRYYGAVSVSCRSIIVVLFNGTVTKL